MKHKQKNHILDLTIEEWESHLLEFGFKKYRAKQVFQALHNRQAFDIDSISNIPLELKEHLKENFRLPLMELMTHEKSKIDNTAKLLWKLDRDKKIETVWLPYRNRQSLCVSVQSGCTLSCSFCASGKIPFKGNLSSGEIIEQIYRTQNIYQKRVSNVVFMGMGEPFHNYEDSIKAAHTLCHSFGLELSTRKITLSTSGVLTGIKKFIQSKEPFNLALSVHAIQSNKRYHLMDIEKNSPLEEITAFIIENRNILRKDQLMIEYIMIDDFNMFDEDVRLLSKMAKKIRAKINLIPLNTDYLEHKRPPATKIEDFWKKLCNTGVLTFNRSSPGFDINGACGMLSLVNT